MKKLFYIVLFNITAISFAQNPQLFENDWYLYEVMSSNLGTHFDVSNINPPIAPYMRISEDLSYSGEGACNTYSGTYEYLQETLNSINFTSTTDNCNIQQHNSFESEFFGFISGGYLYTITEDSIGKVLTFETPIFGYAVFKSYPLSTSIFQKNKFQLYPNPAKDQVFISAASNPENLKIKIFNT